MGFDWFTKTFFSDAKNPSGFIYVAVNSRYQSSSSLTKADDSIYSSSFSNNSENDLEGSNFDLNSLFYLKIIDFNLKSW